MGSDTLYLLRECNSGVKMGVATIDDVLDKVENKEFYRLLKDSKEEHSKLGDETHILLEKMGDDGKEPHPVAKTMAHVMTTMASSMDENDARIADLVTDGCNNGVKNLHRYMNQYPNADEQAKEITRRLVNIEERLAVDIRNYL